jgi:hypothetical protein
MFRQVVSTLGKVPLGIERFNLLNPAEHCDCVLCVPLCNLSTQYAGVRDCVVAFFLDVMLCTTVQLHKHF